MASAQGPAAYWCDAAGQPLSAAAWDDPRSQALALQLHGAGPGVLLDYSQREKDGTVILQTDQRVYLDPLIGAAPKPGDTLTIGTEIFNVVHSKPLAPAGIVVLHDVQVRVS